MRIKVGDKVYVIDVNSLEVKEATIKQYPTFTKEFALTSLGVYPVKKIFFSRRKTERYLKKNREMIILKRDVTELQTNISELTSLFFTLKEKKETKK